MMTTVSHDVASIKRMIAAGDVVRGTAGGTAGGSVRTETNSQTLRLLREFSHCGNDYRRVPPSWNIPQSGLQSMHLYWHCGDETKNIPPMKFLEKRDVRHLGRRAPTTLAEIRRVMTIIDGRAKSKGLHARDFMGHDEVNSMYSHGEAAISEVVPANTNSGRKRNVARLKVSSAVKFAAKKRRKDVNISE